MNPPPLPPNEAEMTPAQIKAFRRIQQLIREHFSHGMLSVVYVGTDQRFHIELALAVTTKEQALDLATRTLREVEKAERGIISTLTPEERRIAE